MSQDVHTVSMVKGMPFRSLDKLKMGLLLNVVTPQGNGDVATVPVSTAGVYPGPTVPTVAVANAGTGSGQTFAAVMKAVGVAIAAAGSTYAAADTITLTGGAGTQAVITVDTVDGSGHILTCHISTVGAYTALPTSPVAQGSSSGSGTAATFTMSWGIASVTIAGTSNHQYPAGVTAGVSGGSPTTAAVLGTPTLTSVAGQGFSLVVNSTLVRGLSLPPSYGVWPCPNSDFVCNVTSKTAAGFTLNVNPRLASQTIAAGTVDLLVAA